MSNNALSVSDRSILEIGGAQEMSALLRLLSFIALGLTVIPAFLVFTQIIAWDAYLTMMAVGTLLWFATAPFWMKKDA